MRLTEDIIPAEQVEMPSHPSIPPNPAASESTRRDFLMQMFVLLGALLGPSAAEGADRKVSLWKNKFFNLPVAKVHDLQKKGPPQALLPSVCVTTEDTLGSGIFIRKNNKLYVLSARHVVEDLGQDYTYLKKHRDTAIFQCSPKMKNYEAYLKSAREYNYFAQTHKMNSDDVDGEMIEIAGCHPQGYTQISGKCLYTEKELYTLMKGKSKLPDDYWKNRLVIRLPGRFDARGLSGSPVYTTYENKKRLAGLVIAQFGDPQAHGLVMSTPEDMYAALDAI